MTVCFLDDYTACTTFIHRQHISSRFTEIIGIDPHANRHVVGASQDVGVIALNF
jgi:hypothetical protein